jgi:membrane-bound acyltransferase YfiQ involved in biofilm formation
MFAVIIVFCVGYLFEGLRPLADWITLSISTKSFAAVPRFSGRHALAGWLFAFALSAYAGILTLRFWTYVKGMRDVTEHMKQISVNLQNLATTLNQAVAAARAEAPSTPQLD